MIECILLAGQLMIHATHDIPSGVNVSPNSVDYELFAPVVGTSFTNTVSPESDIVELNMATDRMIYQVYIRKSNYGEFTIQGLLQSCPIGSN